MEDQNPQRSRLTTSATAPSSSHRRNDESWVEIASQPSSSSLSSIGDEIVTTGLHVAGSYPPRRRRPGHGRHGYTHQYQNTHHPHSHPHPHVHPFRQTGGASSQEEYEASDSEEEHALASSNEQVPAAQITQRPHFQRPAHPDTDSDEYDEDDDDDHATALGTRAPSDHVFRPQPNAFSNPPSTVSRRRQSSSGNTVIAPGHPHGGVGRPHMSHRGQTRSRAREPDFLSAAYQADNDAALRASLTTLLSCAAAARGLNRQKDEEASHRPTGVNGGVAGPSNQPMELRLVPESELMNESPPAAAATAGAGTGQASRPRTSTSSSSTRSASRTGGAEKAKRGASPSSRGARASKKKRTAAATAVVDDTTTLISPTLMTWVVSAGVVVLVSVVGFGAGYVIGREVGRQEVLAAGAGAGSSVNASEATACGREVVRVSGGGLRKLRWAGMGATAVTS